MTPTRKYSLTGLSLAAALVLGACIPLPAESPPLATGPSQAVLAQGVWDGVVAALADGPVALGDIRARLGAAAPHPAELLAVLSGTGCVLPLWRAPAPGQAASRFNRAAAEAYAQGDGDHLALASPAAAGGVAASALEMRLVAALLDGEVPGDASAAIRATLEARLPVWRRFGIAEPITPG